MQFLFNRIRSTTLLTLVTLACVLMQANEAKFLRRARYYDDIGSAYDGPYGNSMHSVATGERALLTVRGARNPYYGSAPAKIAIEDNPYRGPYPRGVYDRLDGFASGLSRPPPFNGYNSGYYNGGAYNGPYGGGFDRPMFGAPNRLAVTRAFPYGYGSRF